MKTRSGHEDPFPRPGPNGRCRFGQETFAGVRANGRDAPIAAIRLRAFSRSDRPKRRIARGGNQGRGAPDVEGEAARAHIAPTGRMLLRATPAWSVSAGVFLTFARVLLVESIKQS